MRHSAGSILAFCLILLLSACADKPPPPGPRVPVALTLGRVQVDLPVGHKAGSFTWNWLGLCDGPFNDVAWMTEGRVPGMMMVAARDGLSQGGLGVTSGAARVLTGRLVDVELSLCRRLDTFTRDRIGTTGEGTVRIDWELTDPPGPVRRFTTQGEGETDIPALDGRYDIILRNATAEAARRLSVLPEFRQLVMSPLGSSGPVAAVSAPMPAAGAAVEMPAVPQSPATVAAMEAVEPDWLLELEATTAFTSPVAPEDVLVDAGHAKGVVVDARGWVLLPDTQAELPTPLTLLLGREGRVASGMVAARAFGFVLVRLPEGEWPAIPIRRQRPAVSQWLHRFEGESKGPVAMVASHAGPARAQGGDLPSLLLDLDEDLWRNPPWILLDAEGRLAALRGPKPLPGDPAPYYAPAAMMAHFRTVMTAGVVP